MNAKNPDPSPQRRLLTLAGLLALWLFLICARLIQLQIFQYGDYVVRAARQQQRSVEVAAQRGVIYDRNRRELAMSVAVDSIFAVPSEIPDPSTTASLLGKILGVDGRELLTRLQSSRAFCWMARKVDAEAAGRVRALNLKGIYFQKEAKRFYPKRELAAQVLGYVGMDDEGLAGLERSYDAGLRGKPGRMLISLDARRKWLGRVERQPEPGANLVLTIDEKIQYIVERELEAAIQQTRSLAGTVIVQDPRTGEILALANRPTFNPNTLGKFGAAALQDRAVSDVYEPGSTFKIVTLAAALEEKLTRPEEVVDCQMGAIEIAGHRIHDHKPFGELTVAQILANSSDVGAIKIALRLGEERFDHYIRAFGFGRQTGIELPGETRGITKPASRWSKTSIAAISMGQEIGVSPLQLVSMISTIANDGVYNSPRVVAGEAAGLQSGPKMAAFHPADGRRVISSLTAAEMKKMLEGVVLFGTGKRALLEGYSVAGKTGTAQKVDPATGNYSRSQYIASFAGFAPVNNPAITVAVILDSPAGPHEGGQVAAPVFGRITQQILAYLNVTRDVPLTDKRRLLLRASAATGTADMADSSSDRLGEALETAEMTPQPSVTEENSLNKPSPPILAAKALPFAADGTHKAGFLREKSKSASATVMVEIEGGLAAPSLLGMPVREALEVAEESGFELDVVGSGLAREQQPPPGARISPGSHIVVQFAR